MSAGGLFQEGAIAQLGERVLCKHEVVGSIPSASTRNFGWMLMSDRDENNFKTFSVFRQCAPHGQRLI